MNRQPAVPPHRRAWVAQALLLALGLSMAPSQGLAAREPTRAHAVLLGAKLAMASASRYDASYRRLPFPGGDISPDRASCADVVVRALRHAGIDLQREVWRDIARAPRAYPMVRRRDPSIDHRRVKTLLPYFLRHAQRRSPRPDDEADPVLPGDVIFFDTLAAMQGPDHVGIASDRSIDGVPLIISALPGTPAVREAPLLRTMTITHRFRP